MLRLMAAGQPERRDAFLDYAHAIEAALLTPEEWHFLQAYGSVDDWKMR